MTVGSSPLALEQIGQISVPVQDLDRAVAFYRDTLGMRFLFQAPPGLAFFDCGGVRLMLAVPETVEGGGAASVIYYRVADLSSTCDALRERGAVLESEPHRVARMPDHELWMAFLRDSEGNLLGLMNEVRV